MIGLNRIPLHLTQSEWEIANAFAKELRADFVATSGYPELSAYLSYAYKNETAAQNFGRDKLPRLIQLKQKWDPEDAFRYCKPLPAK